MTEESPTPPRSVAELQAFAEREERRRRIDQPRIPAVEGERVGSHLLDLFDAGKHGIAKNDPKYAMFKEIVMRCAFDAAGNMYAANEHGKKYNGFDDIYRDKALHKQTIADKRETAKATQRRPELAPYSASSWRDVLHYIPLYTKGLVQTPHPTEVLEKKGIEAEIALHYALENPPQGCPSLFTPSASGGIIPNRSRDGQLMDRMEALYEAMTPVKAPLTIDNEINRSISFSELAFNAVAHIMQGILDPAMRTQHPKDRFNRPILDSKTGEPAELSLRNTAPLTQLELSYFSNLIQACTWSPGDRDSKPDMTAEKLAYGISQNRKNMAMQYAIKIEEILQEYQPKDDPAYNRLSAIRQRVLARINADPNDLPHQQAPADKDQKSFGDKFFDAYLENANGNGDGDLRAKVVRSLRIAASAEALRQERPYASAKEFIDDLEKVRAMQRLGLPGQKRAAHFPAFNGSPILSQMDVLVAQAHNFGDYALRIQIRENAEMHERVMAHLANTCKIAQESCPEGEAGRKAYAEHRLDELSKHRPAKALREKAHAVLNDLESKKTSIYDGIKTLEAKKRLSNEQKEELQALKLQRDTYQTLKGMQLAVENPEAIPQYLIAECRSSADMLETLALLKMMEPVIEPEKPKKPVDLVPLVEYRAQVDGIAGIMRAAYQNRHFKAHSQRVGQANSGLLLRGLLHGIADSENTITVARAKESRGWANEIKPEDHSHVIPCVSVAAAKAHFGVNAEAGDDKRFLVDPETEITKRMTVADIKHAYGIPIPKGEERSEQNLKSIDHAKMVMFAGSDIMKSVGPAGAALTQRKIEELREEMLSWEKPVLLVEYTGSGGGIHRSQPVSTAYETVQGRSMRQTAGSIAQKTVLTMSRFIKRILNLQDTAEQMMTKGDALLGRLAQLNLGNLAGFASKGALWQDTGARCNAWMDDYEKLYKSSEFACMLAYSADKFTKLTSYAARPAGRTRSQKDTGGYPSIVDVKDLRAIGYGAALNVSGSCTSLFFGASQFLGADLGALENLYRKDPKAQDAVNRATWGIVMADLDVAWNYLGRKRHVRGNTVMIGNKTSQSLAQETPEIASLKQKDKGDLTQEEKTTLAVYALAKVDVEYQSVAKTLLALHARIAGVDAPTPDMTHIGEQITELLPKALSAQIQSSLSYIAEPRRWLSEEFKASCQNDTHPLRGEIGDIRKNTDYFDKIYYRMGACFECFENAPRAFTRPYWALEMEKPPERQAGVGR